MISLRAPMYFIALFWALVLAPLGFAFGPSSITGQPKGGGFTLNFAGAQQFGYNNLFTFSRASARSCINTAGQIQQLLTNEPCFDTNPFTLKPQGLLIEGLRTNLLLNSATLSTQNATVTAASHSLSFYGTGSITLSGAATGTLNGTGAYPNRATLVFTPSAGTLTLTVTGSVTFANLEAGAFPSSWIPTTGATATRASEVLQITNLNRLKYNTTQGALFFEFNMQSIAGASNPFFLGIFNDTTDNNAIRASINNLTGTLRFGQGNGGTFSLSNTANAVTTNTIQRAAMSWQPNSLDGVLNGGAVVNIAPGLTIPTVSQLEIGRGPTGLHLFGWMRNITYYPYRLPANQIKAMTVL